MQPSLTVQRSLTPNQIRGFWAAWAGLALDGMDSFIYALVLVPALRELLPASGIKPDAASLGVYGSLLFSVFLVGWGCAFLWGPVADRFGRVRALTLAILCYSVFTFLGCMAANVWELGIFRLLAGFGTGGEFTGAAIFVAEELPEDLRVRAAGFLNSGYYAGTIIAALANYLIGAKYGWRVMFILGGVPALFIGIIRQFVDEPERWKKRVATLGHWKAFDSLRMLFAPEYFRRTCLNCLFLLISMVGLWAGSVYAPGAVTEVSTRMGYGAAAASRIASLATILLASGTIAGCLLMAPLAGRFGRRGALAVYFVLMAVAVAGGFGLAFYLPKIALGAFIACLLFVGIGGASFAVYLTWIPEQYRTECRGSALSLAMSVGRFVAAAATSLVGAGVAHYKTIGIPVAMTSVVFILGLFLLPLAIETRGKPLPE
ncbi:MAG TPA: MFS transporter [Bryobacteraceae bacterium]|nr:MFS transporter [Bryobacteraceae bacterium]